jgi:signal transduction histidine kinase
VRQWLAGRNRRLFIRSYVVLAGALLLAAVLLDRGFSALQERQTRVEDPWFEATMRLVEATLVSSTLAQREVALAELGQRLGMPVRLLGAGDIAATKPAANDTQTLVDDAGNAAIRLGPIKPASDNALFRLLPAAFYLSILVIVGLWLRPLFRDLRVLTDASQKFAADYREPLATAPQTSQLTSLASNLDDMSARISHLIQSQKELTAALSHEMRTPLARIRFALAVIGNQTDATVQSQLRDVNSDVQQIDDLIANMLHYARLDHPGLRTEWQDTPLEAWLRHVLAGCGSRDRQIEVIRVDGVERAWMEPQLMGLALSNLVVNALRYSQRQVVVSIARASDGYRIVVEDDGEGIPDSQRDAIFKAFTRLDTSRNRDTGGFGLGLAIVARIAALHGGRVRAASSERLGGAELVLHWPQEPRQSQTAI